MSYPVAKVFVQVTGLHKQVYVAWERLRAHYPGLVITSTTEQAEGRKVTSLHYQGRAFDVGLETRHGKKVEESKVKEILGNGFDVIGPKADPKGHNDHIHIEWDPK